MDGIGDLDFGGYPLNFRAFDTLSARGLDGGLGLSVWEPPYAIAPETTGIAPEDMIFFQAAPASDLAAFAWQPALDEAPLATVEVVSAPEFAGSAAHHASPLFTDFSWPEQTLLAFDNDDAFVAPVRFAGRTVFSWL